MNRHAHEPALLDVERLSVTANIDGRRRTLVRDVSLQVQRGQTLGVVGESGSGKSLTALATVGLLPGGIHATGSATYDGIQLIGSGERVLRSLRGSRISLLLQDPFTMLNPLQTAGAHLAESLPFGLRRSRVQCRAEVARRLLEVGLGPEMAGRYPFQLSGGMRQRVALAAALAGDPELLIADEPTTALDATTQADVLDLLAVVQRRRGMALILITHDLRVAFSVCDRVQVMYAGSVVEQSPAHDLMTDPAHPYSLGLLLAEPPADQYLDRLISIPGSVPQAESVADVCAFAERCAWAQPKCTVARPDLAAFGGQRLSACIRRAEIHGDLRQSLAQLNLAVSAPPPPPVGTAIATLTGISKSFRTTPLVGRAQHTTALDNVGFSIAEHESLGVVGETGSGKTTIARAILGLTTPDSGSIELAGIQAADYRRLTRSQRQQVRRFVQVVFQDPYSSLNPALTVGSTLREVLARRECVAGLGEDVSTLLALVGLPASYAGKRPAALSGGERQRIAIARAIAMRPRLLICDEPVAALDVSAQAQVLELLREIRRTMDMSMLFITHDISVVRQMTDRVIVLYRGQIVETGETTAVLDHPRHDYTRRLLNAALGRQR